MSRRVPQIVTLVSVWSLALVAGGLVYHDFTSPKVFGDDPPKTGIVLKAPKTCKVGELVELDARASTVEGPFEWRVIPETPHFVVTDSGRRAFFAQPRGGEFLVVIAGAADGKPVLKIHVIKVQGGSGPAQTLSEHVYLWYQDVEEYEGKQVDAVKLAQSFMALSGASIEPNQLMDATVKAVNAALGGNLEHWMPFLDSLGDYLDKHRPTDYAATWREIAQAINEAL